MPYPVFRKQDSERANSLVFLPGKECWTPTSLARADPHDHTRQKVFKKGVRVKEGAKGLHHVRASLCDGTPTRDGQTRLSPSICVCALFTTTAVPARVPASSDFSYKRSNCKPIPANLQLCHGIEYQNMRLPNLLGHETMKEVLEQAGAWIPLVMKQCHPDTKKFLCSLFAPVCLDDLDETIQPCHSLCVQDNDLCIPLASSDHLLPATEEALKIKVKEITYINRDTKIILETKSKTIYKLNGVSERDLKKSVLWLKDSLQCTCEEMNDINAPYLVMGQKLGGELVITSVKRWQKGQREFKRISRSIRKLQC
ncbi:secreted frizzled-related protein 2 precursor [Camelus ferus]|nr:secreted frizzled-related protein 2 precursor [Camelus ferus]